MLVAVAQIACRQNQPHENFRRVAEWMTRAAASRAELIVFPELYNTGCTADGITQGAVEERGSEIAELCELSDKLKLAVVIGLAEKDGDDVFNSCFLLAPAKGVLKKYRKVHLCPFSPFFENLIMKPGDEPAIVAYNGFKIGLSVCFDLRFPEYYRRLSAAGCDLLINSSSWPRVRVKHWEALLAARAIENQAYVIGSNQVGSHKDLIFAGRSRILDPLGEVIVESGPDSEELLMADLSPEKCAEIRKTFPVLQLRRLDV